MDSRNQLEIVFICLAVFLVQKIFLKKRFYLRLAISYTIYIHRSKYLESKQDYYFALSMIVNKQNEFRMYNKIVRFYRFMKSLCVVILMSRPFRLLFSQEQRERECESIDSFASATRFTFTPNSNRNCSCTDKKKMISIGIILVRKNSFPNVRWLSLNWAAIFKYHI